MVHLSHIANVMATATVAPGGARASAAMKLTKFARNIKPRAFLVVRDSNQWYWVLINQDFIFAFTVPNKVYYNNYISTFQNQIQKVQYKTLYLKLSCAKWQPFCLGLHVYTACPSYMSRYRWHQMETFSALLALWEGNSPVTGEFPSQRPVTLTFGGLFALRLKKRLSEQSKRRWLETSSRPLWRHCNAGTAFLIHGL